jgi:hypothetical protein
MNRIRFLGLSFCADAAPADSVISPADSSVIERRMKISPEKRISGLSAVASV